MQRFASGTWQVFFLAVFAAVMVCVWMLPVAFIGYSYWLPVSVLNAKTFAETGVLLEENMRWMPLVLQPFAFIGWQNVVGWTVLSAIMMAVALLPLWVVVRRLFDRTMAWVTVVLFALMPMNWVLALQLDGYALAFFFLFFGFALYLALERTRRRLAVALFGLCFGCTLASRDAFLALLPGIALVYLWQEKRRWKGGVGEVLLACALAYVTFTLPLYPNALKSGMTAGERLAVFLPSFDNSAPEEGHLYPDEYTYEVDKEEYDALLREQGKTESFLERQQDANYEMLFGVSARTVGASVFNSAWVFFNALPSFLHPQTLGGPVVWLLLLPGIAWLWRNRRALFVNILIVWAAMEFLLRVVLLFARTHIMDIGGAMALIAAAGTIAVATAWHAQWKRRSVVSLSVMAVAIVAVQLLQVNRTQFAVLYAKSETPLAYAAAQALRDVPEDAVVAHPRKPALFYFDAHRNVAVNPETIDRLSPGKRVAEPFRHYGVTHIIGYGAADVRAIKQAIPEIKVIALPDPEALGIAFTPLLKYVLNAFR